MAPRTDPVTWADVSAQVERIAAWHKPRPVFGIPRGGCVPAAMLAALWKVPVLDAPAAGCLVVDDLIDTGRTAAPYVDAGYAVDALYRKPHSPPGPQETREGWIVFPWETAETGPEDAVVRLLEWVGEDTERDGLADTPKRVTKALREMTVGYEADVAEILATQFDQEELPYSGIVSLRRVPFHSMCEHHMLPFSGTADVAYIPGDTGRIVGLSKLARLVDAFARRLQVQERMTVQIVEALEEHLQPLGAACVVRAHHSCMALRGVGKDTGGMVTSEIRGAFYDDPRARSELMHLLGGSA